MDVGGSRWLGVAAEAYDGRLREGGDEPTLRVVAGVVSRRRVHDGPPQRLDPRLDALDRQLAAQGRAAARVKHDQAARAPWLAERGA